MAQAHPNAEIAGKFWSAVADGNAEALEEVLAPDVVWRVVGNNRVAGKYRGPSAVIGYLATLGEETDSFVSKLHGIYSGTDGAVLAHHVSATRGSKRVEMDFLVRLGIRDGRISTAVSVAVDQRANDAFWG